MTIYTSSDGTEHVIEEMEHTHLQAAFAKLTNSGPAGTERLGEIEAMRRQIAINNALYEERQAELTGEGVTVGSALSNTGKAGFAAFNAEGEPIGDTWARTENGAWRKAWDAAH